MNVYASDNIAYQRFNTCLSESDKSSCQKLAYTEDLNNMNSKLEIVAICRLLHPSNIKILFFSSIHVIFTKVDQIQTT